VASDAWDLFEAGSLADARKKMREEVAAARSAGDRRREAVAIDFEGLIYQREGQPELAAESHRTALQLLEGMAGSSALAARTNARNNLGVARYFGGQYEEALETLEEVLNTTQLSLQNAQHRLALGRALNNRGLVYQELGQEDDARTSFDRAARTASRRTASHLEKLLRAQALNNLARSYESDDAGVAEARDKLLEAQRLARELGNPLLEANILDSLAGILLDATRSPDDRQLLEEAVQRLDEASALEGRASAPVIKATILKNRGRALSRLGRVPEAAAAFDEAARGAAALRLPGLQRDVLGARAAFRAREGRLEAAIADYERAIELAESTQGRGLRENQRQSLAALQQLYVGMVESLIKRGDVDRALDYLDRSKSAILRRELMQHTPSLRDKDAEKALSGYYGLLKREEALAAQTMLMQAAGDEKAEAAKALSAQLDAVRQSATQALNELQQKYGQTQYASYFSFSPLDFTQLSRLLPPGHLVVTFFTAEDRLYLFLASHQTGFTWRQVPGVGRSELVRRVKRYRELLTGGRRPLQIDSWEDPEWTELRDLSAALYRDLLQPIEREWKQARHLILAPTGILHYLPFQALGPYDPQTKQLRFLILDTAVSYLTNANRTDLTSRSPQQRERTLLALGNPPYQHERPRLAPLPFAEIEVQRLQRIFGARALAMAGPDATLQNLRAHLAPAAGGTAIAVGESTTVPGAATRAAGAATTEPGGAATAPGGAASAPGGATTAPGGRGVTPTTPSRFGIVHLATHGIVNARSPADSWLALDGTNRLRASDVATLGLDATHLVTLSACETAIAEEKPGTDVMSLATYFTTAGVPSMVVSLWKVDDRATGELMAKFYEVLVSQPDPLDKARALQAAQIELASRPQTRHPFFWAPFVLFGDWR
jgi:CHAT domain-containing protein/Tfp pilus assembly protein PilF